MTAKADATADRTLIELALKRFRLASDAESDLRKLQLEDKKFAAGKQWPADIEKTRQADGRPCLTIDRLGPQIKQVTNQLRQTRPSVQINPVDNGADMDTAEVLQGLIKHIEVVSDADVAYDQAGSDAAIIGRGFFEIRTDYESDDSFDQEIRIARIRNPFTVYFDPHCQAIDYSDARWCFVIEDMPLETYKELYGESKAAADVAFGDLDSNAQAWFTDERRKVANYWYVETTETPLEAPAATADGEKRTRTVETRKVCCVKMNGLEVLERYEWLGKYIPIVPVIGEEVDLEGKVDYRGMVRRAKDPQRMGNFWKSAATEMVALAPKAPYIMAEGQDEHREKMWDTANTRNWSRMIYKPTTLLGTLAPPPKRDVAEPPIQALMISIAGAENDLRATTGFYDVDSRDRKETSGKAILARQQQGEHGNSDFLDGLSRAIRHCGRILVDLIPKIYDVPRIRRITGRDGKDKNVMVHAGNPPSEAPQMDDLAGVFDLNVGRYDVVISVGPSSQTMRQEFVETLSRVFEANPNVFPLAADLFFENMDMPNARQLAERFKKMLPPQLQDEQGPPPIPPEVQEQLQMGQQIMQQMQQQIQALEQELKSKQLEVESNERIKAAEIQSKEQIERMKLMAEQQIAQLKLDAEQAKAVFAANVDAQRHQADLQHERVTLDTNQQHDREMAAQTPTNA